MRNSILFFFGVLLSVNATFAEPADVQIKIEKGCARTSWAYACEGTPVYVLEDRSLYVRDEEEHTITAKVDSMKIVKITSEKSVSVKGAILGGSSVVEVKHLIVRAGCALKKKYCVGEEVYSPGHVIVAKGKIVGIFFDGRVLVERLGEKTIMNIRDVVRLRD
jgi:hypothetical protein